MKLHLNLEHVKIVLFELAPQTADELHAHADAYQMSIPWNNNAILRVDDVEREVDAHNRLVITPGMSHQHLATENGARILLVTVDRDFLTDAARAQAEQSLAPIEFALWGDAGADHLQKYLESLLQKSLLAPLTDLEKQEFETELVQKLLTLQPGSHTPFFKRAVQTTTHPALNLVLQYIHDQMDTELSLDRLSQASNISKFHMVRLFQEHLGQTPHQYIRELRLHHAEQLLRTTRASVTDIACQIGFGSLGAFERAFKQQYGVTASVFRKKL